MNGESGRDSTFFDANSAVKAGIIPSQHILSTSKQICDKVKNELNLINDVTEIQLFMSQISMELTTLQAENKHLPPSFPTLKQTQNDTSMNDANKPSAEYSTVAATLGFKDNYEVKDVMARISELTGVEAKLKDTERKLNDAETVIAGKDATIKNLQKENGDKTSLLEKYQKREAEEQKAKVENLVNSAITAGKIDKSAKDEWVKMAEANYPLAENTLNSIPALGYLAAFKITAFKTLIGDILNKMKTAQEISGYAVNIDPNQNVLVTNSLKIGYVLVPVGVATGIYVEEGLSLTEK